MIGALAVITMPKAVPAKISWVTLLGFLRPMGCDPSLKTRLARLSHWPKPTTIPAMVTNTTEVTAAMPGSSPISLKKRL